MTDIPMKWVSDLGLVPLTPEEIAQRAVDAAEPPNFPARLFTGAEITAAIGRWGPAGVNAIQALTDLQFLEISAGNIPATHQALAALLAAAGKTEADL